VLNGEQVQLREALFDFRTPYDLIKRGKVQTPIEFGHKVFLAESGRGLITQYEVLDGNPVDEQHVIASLKSHKQAFGHAPTCMEAIAVFSEHNVRRANRMRQGGVHPQRAAPKHPSARLMRRAVSSRTASAFAPHRGAHLGVVPRSRHEALSR